MGVVRFIVAILLIILCVAPAWAQGPVPVATGEWAPFTSETLPDQGFATAVVRKAFAKMGQQPEVSFYPWKRCYDMVLSGEVWGAFPYSWTEGRATEVLFSEPFSYSDTGWFYAGSAPLTRYEQLSDMKGIRIGGIFGYFYEEALDEAGLTVEYAPDEVSVLKMLLAGRVDVVIMNVLVADTIIREHFPNEAEKIVQLKGLYSRNALRMVVSQKYPGGRELLDAFNAALKKTRGPVEPSQVTETSSD